MNMLKLCLVCVLVFAVQCSVVSRFKVCRRVDSSEAHAERAVLREQLDLAYDVLKLKPTEERNMVQDVAQVAFVTMCCDVCLHTLCKLVPMRSGSIDMCWTDSLI